MKNTNSSQMIYEHIKKTPIYWTKEFLFCVKLKLWNSFFRDECRGLGDEEFERIKDICSTAFPSGDRTFEFVDNIKIFLKECRCLINEQIIYKIWDDCVVLMTEHYNCFELLLCAGVSGKTSSIFDIYNFIKKYTLNKTVYVDGREVTAYKFIKLAEKFGKAKIESDVIHEINDEKYHWMRLRWNNK